MQITDVVEAKLSLFAFAGQEVQAVEPDPLKY
jgi:hypothetical protein